MTPPLPPCPNRASTPQPTRTPRPNRGQMEGALAVAEKVEAVVASAGAADAEQGGDNQPPRGAMPGLEAAGKEVAGMATAAVAGVAAAWSRTGTVRQCPTLTLTLALTPTLALLTRTRTQTRTRTRTHNRRWRATPRAGGLL